MARLLLRSRREVCRDRLVAVLEGGYDLEALARSVGGGARRDEAERH